MNKEPTFTFKNSKGIKYAVYVQKYNKISGDCDPPHLRKPVIRINKNLKPRRLLSVTIEEFIHAEFFKENEKPVRKLAANLTKFLYQQGWSLK